MRAVGSIGACQRNIYGSIIWSCHPDAGQQGRATRRGALTLWFDNTICTNGGN